VYHPVRVVGQTKRPVKTRLIEHVSHGVNGRFVCEDEALWVQALRKEGLRPGIVVLEECTEDLLDEKEQHWIALGLSLGWKLLNENAGGKGRERLTKPPSS
jgi:hypothetical protein